MVEIVYIIFNISAAAIAATSIPITGCILLCIYHLYIKKKRRTTNSIIAIINLIGDRRALLYTAVGAMFLSAALFLGYDAIPRIGAGKVMLLQVPIESAFTILLARYFLSERLRRVQIIGLAVIMSGCILSMASGTAANAATPLSTTTTSITITMTGIGEVEAVLAGVLSSLSIITFAKLLNEQQYHGAELTGFRLLFAGIPITIGIFIFYPQSASLTIGDWIGILSASLTSLVAWVCFYAAIQSSGASVTTVISSLSVLVTLLIQLFLLRTTALPLMIAANIPLALTGGVISVIGIYLLFTPAGCRYLYK